MPEAITTGEEKTDPATPAGEPSTTLTEQVKGESNAGQAPTEKAKDAGKPADETKPTTNTDEDKSKGAGEGKPSEAKTDPEIELNLPEGVEANDALVAKLKATAKELGLKSEGAQKLFNLHVEQLKELAAKGRQQEVDEVKGWAAAAKADKEYGGQAFNANAAIARKAVDKFGSPEFKRLLGEAGLGNHPEMIRFCLSVGRALAEDSVAGTHSAAGGVSQKPLEEVLYANSMFKK